MIQLPEGFHPFKNQVAGHSFTDQNPSLGVLMQKNSDCVLKPLGKPECGKRELNFYETLHSSKDPILIKLKPLVPKYYNKVNLEVNQRQHAFIKLEDLTSGMQKPCIMDIKVGRRTWDPLATVEKRNVEEQKYAKCKKSLGLSLPGFQMYCIDNGACSLTRHGKEYGKQLDENGFRKTMALFLNSQRSECRVLVDEVLRQLHAIRSWFTIQKIYHFYASSILIAYDANLLLQERVDNYCAALNRHLKAENDCPTSSTMNLLKANDIKVRMIDFAHVFPAENGSLDTNYLFGLQNLITILEHLVQANNI